MNRLVKIPSAMGAIVLLAQCFMLGADNARINIAQRSWDTNSAEAQRIPERTYFAHRVMHPAVSGGANICPMKTGGSDPHRHGIRGCCLVKRLADG